MANDDNIIINAKFVDNVSSGLEKMARRLRSLENDISDLVGAFEDLRSAQAKYGSSSSDVAKSASRASDSIDNVAKSATKAKSSVQDIAKAFKSSGLEEISKLKLTSLNQLSGKQIGDLAGRLKEAGSSLAEFIGKGEGIANVNAEALAAGQSFKALSATLDGLAKGDFSNTLKSITEMPEELRGLDKLVNFDQLRGEAQAADNQVKELQEQLRQIGPAARNGDQEAIKQMRQLEGQVDETFVKVTRLNRELNEAMDQFSGRIGTTNRNLAAMGFQQVGITDIFPTEQMRRAQAIEQAIDGIVRRNVEVGATRKAFENLLSKKTVENLDNFDAKIVGLTAHLPRLRYALYDVSNNLAILGAGLIAAGGYAVTVAADFERSFADVQRTTGVAGEAAEGLKESLISLSQDIPVSFSDLADIATLAGQLNIATDVVDEFTETVAKFAATTDVTVEAAATAFGRLDQLVEGVNGRFNQLGSSILKVGVNAVATESEIINISTQIASIANIAGFSASELVGLSAALASVGTRPELSRGTFTRLFTEIQQAVAEGGNQLNAFARVSRMSSAEFEAAWGAGSGADLTISILEGLAAEGQNAQASLAELGITSVRDVPTILKLAQSVDEVKKQIAIANLGFIEGTELNNQYGTITQTTSEKLALLSNNVKALVENIGSLSGPFSLVLDLLIGLTKAAERFIDNPFNQVIAGTVSAISLILGVGALFLSLIGRMTGGVIGFTTANIETRNALGLMNIALGELTLSTKVNTVATTENVTAREAEALVLRQEAAALGQSSVASDINTAAKNRNSAAMLSFAKNTKIATGGLIALKAAGIVGVISTIAFLAYEAGRAFGFWGEKVDDLNKVISNADEYVQALAEDTRAYNKAVGDARNNFQTFTVDIENAGEEISNYGKILLNTGEYGDNFADIINDSTEALGKQTIAIGENTRELLKRQIVQDLVSKNEPKGFFSAEPTLTATEIQQQAFAQGELISFNEASRRAQELKKVYKDLETVFASPAISNALAEAGFDFAEFLEIAVTQGESAANAYAENFTPAIESVIETLSSEAPGQFATEIEALRAIGDGGTAALFELAAGSDEVQRAMREAAIEAVLNGEAIGEAAQDYETFADVLKGAFEELYGPINAQREVESAVRSLGAAFAEESPEIVASSREMQAAIFAIIDAASSEEEAIAGLNGLYAAIVNGGYASREQLALLADQIIATYKTAAQTQINLLKEQQAALRISQALADGGRRGGGYQQYKEFQSLNQQIAAQEKLIQNAEQIVLGNAESAKYANELANGYKEATAEAGGTADAVKDVADNTEEAVEKVRTLLDYASDLEKVFSRAFDIRFGAQSALDKLTSGWRSFAETVNEAKNAVEELRQSQEDLAGDIAIKQYFLSVAQAYGDTLRAAQLRNEIAELESKRLQQQAELEQAQATTDTATSLEGDSEQAIANRQALTGLVKNYQDYIKVLAESGATQKELKAATEEARQQFIQQAIELGFQEQVVLEYAAAFDDVQTAISKVERNITVEANVDPALQALAELKASLQTNINKAKELNNELDQKKGKYTPEGDPNAERRAKIQARIDALRARLTLADPYERQVIINEINTLRGVLASFASGGYTGAGGKYQPAGIVHKGEYVVPKQYVNQSSGLPNAQFLAQLQNGMRGYAMGGFVGGGSEGPMMVELSPYDRKLLSDAGNVQLMLNGRVVAQATNASNYNEARRGSN